jgi:hypothetical protein
MAFSNSPRWTDPKLQTRARLVARCAEKARHHSQGSAEAHIRALAKGGYEVPQNLTPYRCQFCEGWHVGRLPSF